MLLIRGFFCYYIGTTLVPLLKGLFGYIYYPGIQGYFDYASAIYLLELYKHPSEIIFEKHGNVNKNMLYSLAVISIQKYNYLITQNSSINKVLFHDAFIELQFYALQHSDFKTADQYKKQILDIMRGMMVQSYDRYRSIMNHTVSMIDLSS